MKNKKAVFLILIIAVVVLGMSTSGYFIYANLDKRTNERADDLEKFLSIKSSEERGKAYRQAINADDDAILAYINGEAIYRNEVVFDKMCYMDGYAYDQTYGNGTVKLQKDEYFIRNVAIFKLLPTLLKEVGIECARDEAVGKARASIELMKSRADAGGEEAAKVLEETCDYLKGLGVTEEEYIAGIGAELEYRISLSTAYVQYYYGRDRAGKDMSEFTVDGYDKHLNEKLQQYGFRIVSERLAD